MSVCFSVSPREHWRAGRLSGMSLFGASMKNPPTVSVSFTDHSMGPASLSMCARWCMSSYMDCSLAHRAEQRDRRLGGKGPKDRAVYSLCNRNNTPHKGPHIVVKQRATLTTRGNLQEHNVEGTKSKKTHTQHTHSRAHAYSSHTKQTRASSYILACTLNTHSQAHAYSHTQ